MTLSNIISRNIFFLIFSKLLASQYGANIFLVDVESKIVFMQFCCLFSIININIALNFIELPMELLTIYGIFFPFVRTWTGILLTCTAFLWIIDNSSKRIKDKMIKVLFWCQKWLCWYWEALPRYCLHSVHVYKL